MHYPIGDGTYLGLCYTSRGALVGTRKFNGYTMADQSDYPSHHGRMLYHKTTSFFSIDMILIKRTLLIIFSSNFYLTDTLLYLKCTLT